MARILARKFAKVTLLITIFITTGRTLSNPDSFISHAFACKLALVISGDINAESIYDAYFYTDVVIVTFITALIYLTIMKTFRKIRKH